MILLFIGPSGSGKDTQAELLREDNSSFHRISTGELLREISSGEYRIQKIIRDSMNKGFLADNFVFGLLETYLKATNYNDIIFSAVVRTFAQIELLDFVLFKIGKKLDKVVYFELDDNEAVKRMTSRLVCPNDGLNFNILSKPPQIEGVCDECGAHLIQREDDNEESIRHRIKDFHKDNDEIIEEYESRGMLIRVDSSKSIQQVNLDLKYKLKI
jgi:adenylate kinase